MSKDVKKRRYGPPTEAVKVYELFPEDHPERKSGFWIGDRTKLPDSPYPIERAAERDRQRAIMIYGGNWIIIRCWESLFAEQAPEPDDGLRGEAAREQAEKNILAGPNTPGRRFLQKYLAERGRLPAGTKELVESVGGALSGKKKGQYVHTQQE